MARRGFIRRVLDKFFGETPAPTRDKPIVTRNPAPPKTPPTPPRQPPPEDGAQVFESDDRIKHAVKMTKVSFWGDSVGFGRNASNRNVDRSSDIEEMQQALDPANRNDDTWSELASQASYAHKALEKTGDAGELEMYLPYSFLWYHYLG